MEQARCHVPKAYFKLIKLKTGMNKKQPIVKAFKRTIKDNVIEPEKHLADYLAEVNLDPVA